MQGCNIIDNGRHAFYTYVCSDPETVIEAENNWWGVADADSIEAMVYHKTDCLNCATIDYVPFASEAFVFDDPTGIFDLPDAGVPSAFTLQQNYPNPFNLSTVIRFSISEPAVVEIIVYDILGRKIRKLAAGHYSSGAHEIAFDGRDYRNKPLPSGVYLYRLTAGHLSETRKMVLFK